MGAATATALGGRNENQTLTGLEQPDTTVYVDVEMSNSYGPGGDLCDVSAVLADRCYGGVVAGKIVTADDDLKFAIVPGPSDNPAMMRVRAFVVTTGVEVAAAVDLSGETIRLALDGR